jgi:hypothetical protein
MFVLSDHVKAFLTSTVLVGVAEIGENTPRSRIARERLVWVQANACAASVTPKPQDPGLGAAQGSTTWKPS